MKIAVENTTARGDFGLTHPIDLVLDGQHLRIGQTYEEAYRLCVELCSFLYDAGQLAGYQIRTKSGSQLNHEVTKDW